MRDLEALTANVTPYKTKKRAMNVFNRVVADEEFLGFIYERKDGSFVPIAVLNPKNMWLALTLADAGALVLSA